MANALNFGAWNKSKSSKLFSELRAWEAHVFAEYKAYVKDENFDTVTKHQINLQGVLRALDPATRNRLLNQYKKIIGFDDAVAQGSMRELRPGKKGRPAVSKFVTNKNDLTGPNANPLAIMYNRFFINTNEVDGSLNFSSNILKADYLEQLTSDMTAPFTFRPGGKVMVLDTETTGLPYNSAKGTNVFPDLRQVSSSRMSVRSDGRLSRVTNEFDEYFMTARMQMGKLYNPDAGVSQRMDEWIANLMIPEGKSVRNTIPGGGDEFVAALRPFLEQMKSTDYVVGHNIAFDLDQILGGLSKTRAYQQNENGFRDLLDEVRVSMETQGKIKDTMEMARVMLPEIETAAELSFGGERVTQHSIQNLMLQTNLTDLLKRDMGDRFDEMIGIGQKTSLLHAGQVDTEIEAHLLRYLVDLQDGRGDPAQSLRILAKNEAIPAIYRQAILKSYAPTPISNIKDISHIDPEIFRRMYEAKDDSIRLRDPMTGDAMPIAEHSIDEVRKLIGQNGGFAAMRITPLEHEMLLDRDLSLPTHTPTEDELLYGMGNWRKYTKQNRPYEGLLNEFGTLFRRGVRDEAGFDNMRKAMARSGLPFAGLSLPERWLTNAIAEASLLSGGGMGGLGDAEKRAATIGTDLGIGRFKARTTAYYNGKKNITLPLDIIRAAEQDDILSTSFSRPLGDEVQMLDLSAYTTPAGKKNVGLSFSIGEEEAEKLSVWLKGLDPKSEIAGQLVRDYGLGRDKLDQIADNIVELGPKYGIGIGNLGGEAGEKAHSVLESFYQGLLRDTDKMPMRVGFIGEQDGAINTGAVILDRLPGEGEKVAYRAGINEAMALHGRLTEAMGNKAKATGAMLAHSTGQGATIKNALELYDNFRGRAKFIGASLGIAAVGGLFLRKRNKLAEGNEALAQMPFEDSTAREQYYNDLGVSAPPQRLMDPLATAGLVASMDRNRTGHHQMGGARNNNLYSGVM